MEHNKSKNKTVLYLIKQTNNFKALNDKTIYKHLLLLYVK